jgi:hypothetical protein
MKRRRSAGLVLKRILDAPNRGEALARLEEDLHRAWADGSCAGFDEGVADANDTPRKPRKNPYPWPS